MRIFRYNKFKIAIGLHVTTVRVVLYLWKIHLYCTRDDGKDETHAAFNLRMSLAKVWLEAFPQSTIAKFYFGNCALYDNIKTLVQAFDVLSIFPAFIMLIAIRFIITVRLRKDPIEKRRSS